MSDPINTPATQPINLLGVGTHVEVKNRLDGRWSRGFEIAAHVNDGYRIRRTSDDTVLPTVFTTDQVRARPGEQENNTWWF